MINARKIVYSLYAWYKSKNSALRAIIAILSISIIWIASGYVVQFDKGPSVLNIKGANNSYQISKFQSKIYDIHITVPCTIENSDSVTIMPSLSGRVAKIFVRDGESIQKGAKILELESQGQQEALKSAIDALKAAKVENNAVTGLYKKGLASNTTKLKSAATLKAAEAEYKNALHALSNSVIRAPVTGIVDKIYVNQGDNISTNSNNERGIATIVSGKSKIKGWISENDVDHIAQNSQAVIEYNKKSLNAKILFISKVMDAKSRTYLAEAELIDEQQLPFGHGKSAVLKILLHPKNAYLIPMSAINIDVDGNLAICIVNDKNIVSVEKISIVGEENDGLLWIVGTNENIWPEELSVVTLGHTYLKNGDIITQ